jgi:GntR family transcriptional repressor for pyruvate dehydrogenase complex
MILESDLKPGAQLPSQQELTEKLGVSRVVLREAVQWLEARGLVEAIQGKGVVVKAPAPASVVRSLRLLLRRHSATLADLWQIRSFLEPEIAALAAQNATPEHLKAMAEAVSQMRNPDSDVSTVIEADMRFHNLLAEATENTVLRLIREVIAVLMHESIEETTGRLPTYDHSAVLEAVRSRDPEAAREAMRRHMQVSRWRWLPENGED